MLRYRLFAYFIVLIFIFSNLIFAQSGHHWIDDQTNTLTRSQVDRLNSRIDDLLKENGSYVFVSVFNRVPSGQRMEVFAKKLLTNKNRQAQLDNHGVLIAVFLQDRRLRIQTDAKVRGRVTDRFAAEVIEHHMAGPFQQGKYYGGISSGLARISDRLRNKTPPLRRSFSSDQRRSLQYMGLILLLLLITIFTTILLPSRNRTYSSQGEDDLGGFWGGFSGDSDDSGDDFDGGGASGSW